MKRLREWIENALRERHTLSEREAQQAVRVERDLTMVAEVYPRGERPSGDCD